MGESISNEGAVLLLIGTRKGLFTARSDPGRGAWNLAGPELQGREVYHAVGDARHEGVAYAATAHSVWGAHLHRSEDRGRSWELLPAVPTAAAGERLKAIWYVAPGPAERPDLLYAGTEPAALFESDDGGASWDAVEALNRHPTRSTWQPARGGLALHSIHVDPRDGERLYVAVSAGGVFRSDNGGSSWRPVNDGVRADYLADTRPETGHCVHRLVMHPARPDRLYRQSHTGTYRSDDGGDHWREITDGLPSDFGYALAVDPGDPDTLFVIPEESSHMRTTVEGRLRVYRSRSAGSDWESLTGGLPQENAYLTVLREAMATDGLEPCGVYFGTSGGHLFASSDAGESWELVAGFLPRILSVSALVIPA